MIEAQIRFIPNEYYHNGAKPIPTPSPTPTPAPEPEKEKEETIEITPTPTPVVYEETKIEEEKVPFYKRWWFMLIAGLVILLLIAGLIALLLWKLFYCYRAVNRRKHKVRPVISGVLTDVASEYIELITPPGAADYRLIQGVANRAKNKGYGPGWICDELTSSGFKTKLPWETMMSATVIDEGEKTEIGERYPKDDEIYQILSENEGKVVKLHFYCDKAGLNETVTFDLPKPKKEEEAQKEVKDNPKEKISDEDKERQKVAKAMHGNRAGLDPDKVGPREVQPD